MATFQVKLKPAAKPNAFGTAHLIVATKLKRVDLTFPNNATTMLAAIDDTLKANLQKNFKVSIGDDEVDVRGFDGKYDKAVLTWKVVPTKIEAGRHKLVVHVVEGKDVDDDDESTVEFNMLIDLPAAEVASEYEVDTLGLAIDPQLLKKIEEIASGGPKSGGVEEVKGERVQHHTIPSSNKSVFYNWEGKKLKVRGVGRHTGKDGQNDQYAVTWHTDGREFTWSRK